MEEIRSRISLGKRALEKVKALATTRRIPIGLRNRFVKYTYWSVWFCMAVKRGPLKRIKNGI